MITAQQILSIGTLTRTHGNKGEVQCLLQNDVWDQTQADFIILHLQHIFTPFRVLEWRDKGADAILFTLRGIDTESQALPLIGSEVFVLKQDIDTSTSSDITWQSLVGYTVTDADQGPLGEVEHVDESTINTLLTLTGGILIPIHEDFILDLNPQSRQLTLRLPFRL